MEEQSRSLVFKLPMQSIQTRKGDFEVESILLTTTAYQLLSTITELIPSSYETQTSSIQTLLSLVAHRLGRVKFRISNFEYLF